MPIRTASDARHIVGVRETEDALGGDSLETLQSPYDRPSVPVHTPSRRSTHARASRRYARAWSLNDTWRQLVAFDPRGDAMTLQTLRARILFTMIWRSERRWRSRDTGVVTY